MDIDVEKILDVFSGLRLYQQQGVRFLVDGDSALLADEMGLGKTVQAAVAMQLLVSSKKCTKVLIVCPSSLCLNWEMELKRWAPKVSVRRVRGNIHDRKAHFYLPFQTWVASYEQVRADIDFLRRECQYDLVILDEAQRIKNASSSVSLACRQLHRKRAWVLTGTPVENTLEDLLSILAFLRPGLLHSALSRNQIHGRMAPFFLRRCKKEVLSELPPIIVQDIKLEMENKQREAYRDELFGVKEHIHQMHGKFSTADILAQITRLKQLCNFDPISEESCKFEALESIIEGLDGKNGKVLVFSQYVGTLRKIMARLDGMPVDCFHGDLSPEERQKMVNMFEKSKGPRLLLISLRAGGVGLNLGSASVVVLFDRWWNPAVENQAIQRAHRYGRKDPLHVIRFLVTDTVEERIGQILKEKQKVFREYVDEAEVADVLPFTKEDLMGIIGLDLRKIW